MPYYKNIGYEGSDLTNAENYYANCISLPMYPSLTDAELTYVISIINNFYNDI
jgi:dTDP-4-amino-4,6-dideoxygalactose transaminase